MLPLFSNLLAVAFLMVERCDCWTGAEAQGNEDRGRRQGTCKLCLLQHDTSLQSCISSRNPDSSEAKYISGIRIYGSESVAEQFNVDAGRHRTARFHCRALARTHDPWSRYLRNCEMFCLGFSLVVGKRMPRKELKPLEKFQVHSLSAKP